MLTQHLHQQDKYKLKLFKFKPIQDNMKEFLKQLSKKYTIGAVGGSDLAKVKEQLVDSKNKKKI